MTTTDFTTTILVDKPAKEVFNAINNVSGWWQGAFNGNTGNLDDVFEYRMKDMHYSKQRVAECVPGKKIVWLVTDSRLNFLKEKSEWNNTKIVFEITEMGDKTQVRFTHVGIVPEIECYDICSNAWEQLIQKSLYSLITEGKGVSVFEE